MSKLFLFYCWCARTRPQEGETCPPGHAREPTVLCCRYHRPSVDRPADKNSESIKDIFDSREDRQPQRLYGPSQPVTAIKTGFSELMRAAHLE